jgi:nitronate monooxygenase
VCQVSCICRAFSRPISRCICLCRYRVPLYITSLGAREDIYAAAHSSGGVVLHDIINNSFARKAISKGADGLVAVAAGCTPHHIRQPVLFVECAIAGAGGHAGTKSPFALIQEIRQ